MNLRCPYCKAVFAPQESCMCPACGKAMNMPWRLRTRSKPKRATSAEETRLRRLRGGGAPHLLTVRYPRVMLAGLIVLFFAATLLFTRPRQSGSRVSVNYGEQAKIGIVCHELVDIGNALVRFNDDCGRYPTEQEGLAALLINPGVSNWHGPYPENKISDPWNDPWKRPYHYELVDDRANVLSAGPDGIAGNDDDRVNPQYHVHVPDPVQEALERAIAESASAGSGSVETTELSGLPPQ